MKTVYDANGTLRTRATADANGALVSIYERKADGEIVETFYSGGRATDAIVADAFGSTQTIVYNADRSSRVTVYDQEGAASVVHEIDAAGDLVTQIGLNADGTVAWQQDIGASDADSSFSAQGRTLSLSQVASTLGSTIGSFLGSNSLVGQIGASTAIGTIAGKFGELIERFGDFAANGATVAFAGVSLFDDALKLSVTPNAQTGAIGTLGWGGNAVASGLSSLLIAEAAQALHLNGFGAAAFNTVGTSITTQLIRNAYGIISAGGDLSVNTASRLFAGLGGESFASGLSANIGGTLGSYIGAMIVPATSREGAIADRSDRRSAR